jgi:hypothetical protein
MTERRRPATLRAATKKGSGEDLLAALDSSLREQARLWNELGDGQNKYELLYGRRPSDRDLEMEVRRQMMKQPPPEVLRWRLALLVGGPLSHE